MNRQLGFFTFAAIIVSAFLLFQITTGCGRQNLLPGSPSAFLQGREAYYRGDYDTALTLLNQATTEGTSAEQREARSIRNRILSAQSGTDTISVIEKILSGVDLSGAGTKETGSLIGTIIPTTEAERANARSAANGWNEQIRLGEVSTQSAEAPEVALANAQAAASALTDAFDTGDGVLEAADVENLSGDEVAALWTVANGGTTESGASGGITEYLQNTLDFGGGLAGEQIGINSGSIGATNESIADINTRILNGEITGAQLAEFLGRGSGGN